MFLWLVVLFASMATAAGDFFSAHLAAIVTTLGISEDLAGVTIFAFGNGSSDLFSTLAAMSSGNGSLAISELFGAAAFITTVVLGLIMVTQPFSVSPASFVGDVVWFIIATASLIAFLADGQLVSGECLGILGLYAAFISHSLLRTRRLDNTDVSTLEAHAEDPLDESARLLASREYQVAETDSNLCLTNENESAEVACPGQSSSAASAHTSTLRSGILKMFPPIQKWKQQSVGEKILTLFSLPLLILIGITTPNIQPSPVQQQLVMSGTAHSAHHTASLDLLNRNFSILLQLLLGPQLLALVLTIQLNFPLPFFSFICPTVLLFSAFLLGLNLTPRMPTVCLLANAIIGFVISLIWIYLTATSAVSLLATLGLILDIPTAILGATIFAIGNSSNDLVANTAVARRGMPVLAASACFGGPMMNMLLGIGVGGLLQVLKASAEGEYKRSAYLFEIHPGLFVSAGTLLVGLAATLVYSFLKGWRLDRPLGIALILLWAAGTVANVVVSVAEPRKTGSD
jgi:sodium/potassium/calcium exchanger 6